MTLYERDLNIQKLLEKQFMLLGLTKAARLVKKSTSTIDFSMRNGVLPYTINGEGYRVANTADLERVFPKKIRIKIGDRIGTRVATSDAVLHNKNYNVNSRCDCGYEQTTTESSFIRSTCCKCGAKGGIKNRKYDSRATIESRLYNLWASMRRRCRPGSGDKSMYWGNRGITVYPEWDKSFEVFEAWALSHGYQNDLTIDRINSDGNYEPSNCEWVTRKENSSRMRKEYRLVKIEKFPSSGILSFGV